MHKVLQQMLSKWTGVHRRPQHTKITLDVWNGLFVEGWAKFVDDQHDQLKVDGTSNIVKGWENVGLITGKIADSAFWKHAVATLGQIGDISSGSAAAVDTTAAGVSAWLLKVNRDRTAIENTPVGTAHDLRPCGPPPPGTAPPPPPAPMEGTAEEAGDAVGR